MSHGATHTHDTTGERPYFPAAEWEEFQQADIQAGKAIVVLMASIFTIGLILYSIVATVVASSPQ